MKYRKLLAIKFIRIIMAIMFLLTGILSFSMNSYATETEMPLVLIESYEVTNDKIVPGEDFTLTLTVKNYSKQVNAENVVLAVYYPQGVAPVYGTTAQLYIGNIGIGKTETISIDFNSFTTIDTETLDFQVGVSTQMTSNSVLLTIPCGSDSPFSILAATIPTIAQVSDSIETSLTFKVLGTENVSNVKVVLSINEEEIANSYIGIVTPGVTKTQNTSVSFKDIGEYIVDMHLFYTDESGLNRKVLIGSRAITVSENGSISEDKGNESPISNETDNSGSNNLMIMGISGILIVLICFIIIALLYYRKR